MRYSKYYVRQIDEADCGAAALATILRCFGSNVSLSIIREVAQTDKSGTTALGLLKAAEKFKLETTPIKADISMFNSNISYPFIAHVNKDSGLLHYIVVLKKRKDTLTVADPDPKDGVHTMKIKDFQEIWTGITLFMKPRKDYQPVKNNQDSLFKTAKLLLKQKYLILSIVLSMIISTGITISGAFFLQTIVDSIVPEKQLSALFIITLGLVIAYLFHGALTYIQGILVTILTKHISINVLLSYIKHLFMLPMDFFEKRKIGEFTSRFSDANNIIETLAKTAITAILNGGTIIVIGTVLLAIDPLLLLISFVAVPVYSFLVFAFVKIFDKWNNQRMESNSTLSSQMIEDLRGMESIKALSVEKKCIIKFVDTFLKRLIQM